MNPLRILLADDSVSVGEYIGELLRSNGHTVTHVQNGEAALAAFRESPPELVLMDVEMPGMGGLEAIKRIRKVLLPVRVPIIVITSHANEATLLDSFMAGADDYLSKPFDPLQLDIRIQAMMRIVSAQRSTAAMVDNVMEGIIRIDRVGRITAFNKAAETIFGYTPSEVLGQNVKMLMPNPDRDKHDEYIGNYVATGEPKIIGKGREVVGLRKNGETFPMHLGVSEAETPDDRFFIGVVRDLTVETALRARLAESRNFLANVIENIPSVTYVKNRQGRNLLVNRKYEEITGKSREQVLGKLDSEIHAPAEAESYRASDLQVMHSGQVLEIEESLSTADGEKYFLSVKFPTRNPAGEITGICGISTEITQIKHYQRELERLSQYDELTGLFNRRHFMSLARHELSRSARYGGELALLMLDIDYFKRVNDDHGHRAGDLVLTAISQEIRQALRETDIPGRLGGEEFAVLLPETGAEQAQQVAERLRKAVAGKIIDIGDEKQLGCTVSIGVAAKPTGPSNDLEGLLHWADTALYAAKNAGRDRVVSAGSDRPA